MYGVAGDRNGGCPRRGLGKGLLYSRGLPVAKKKPSIWVELTCADVAVAFRGEWPGPEGPDEIVAFAREKAMVSGLPVQLEIHGHGVWSIGPTGKVLTGRLFRREKLAAPTERKKGEPLRTIRNRLGSCSEGHARRRSR